MGKKWDRVTLKKSHITMATRQISRYAKHSYDSNTRRYIDHGCYHKRFLTDHEICANCGKFRRLHSQLYFQKMSCSIWEMQCLIDELNQQLIDEFGFDPGETLMCHEFWRSRRDQEPSFQFLWKRDDNLSNALAAVLRMKYKIEE